MLAGQSRAALADIVAAHGAPRFRAAQIGDWIFGKFELEIDKMANLPAALRAALAAEFTSPSSRLVRVEPSGDGTEKLLLELFDGERIEMVIIPTPDRMTFCLSTQVGCPVGCLFCASGADGLVRNLTRGEILEELLFGARRIGRLPDNIVFMGIGEGLLNFAELAAAIDLIIAPDGFGLSPRRLTVSTSGVVPGIRKLAELGRELNLAISLHAVSDAVRAKLMPGPIRYPVAEIMAAADEYREKAGRMVTLEYTLLAGVNDAADDAAALGKLAKAHHAKVNLIPYNEGGGSFRRPPERTIERFFAAVEKTGATVTLRRERGGAQAAACGQLRRTTRPPAAGDGDGD
jgi:23S rRNA (adenine2503-C2)-methyltransferase